MGPAPELGFGGVSLWSISRSPQPDPELRAVLSGVPVRSSCCPAPWGCFPGKLFLCVPQTCCLSASQGARLPGDHRKKQSGDKPPNSAIKCKFTSGTVQRTLMV